MMTFSNDKVYNQFSFVLFTWIHTYSGLNDVRPGTGFFVCLSTFVTFLQEFPGTRYDGGRPINRYTFDRGKKMFLVFATGCRLSEKADGAPMKNDDRHGLSKSDAAVKGSRMYVADVHILHPSLIICHRSFISSMLAGFPSSSFVTVLI